MDAEAQGPRAVGAVTAVAPELRNAAAVAVAVAVAVALTEVGAQTSTGQVLVAPVQME